MAPVRASLLSKPYVNYVYIPSGLLLVGAAICKIEWLPYAFVLTIALASWQFYDIRTSGKSGTRDLKIIHFADIYPSEVETVLKPDEYQKFDLREKTILSHNTAM
jgi:cytochrome-b5 reductase